jgi:hypothetical protein
LRSVPRREAKSLLRRSLRMKGRRSRGRRLTCKANNPVEYDWGIEVEGDKHEAYLGSIRPVRQRASSRRTGVETRYCLNVYVSAACSSGVRIGC